MKMVSRLVTVGDICSLVISGKSKELYSSKVTFCGLMQDTSSTKTWLRVNMKRHLILIFDSITLEIISDDKKGKGEHIFDNYEIAFKTYLGYISTDLLQVENPSASWRGLQNTNWVLLSVMRNKISLSAHEKPYNLIISWNTEYVSYVEATNNKLKLKIRNEDTFVFTSRINRSLCSKIQKSIEPYLIKYDYIDDNAKQDPVRWYDDTYCVDLNEYASLFYISSGDYLTTSLSPNLKEPRFTDIGTRQYTHSYLELQEISGSQATLQNRAETLMAKTLDKVVRCKPPARDTLQLPTDIRNTLCFKLYSNSILPNRRDWEVFAECIGLNASAVNMIASLVMNQHVGCTAPEIVLRHWQYMYNEHGQTEETGPCPRACTRTELRKLLHELERFDLLELVNKSI